MTAADRPKAIAFYLPQFHPIPENDQWWGPGFTEWRNVVRARPLYPGQYQPRLPGELGFYDLRLPEVREAQASLARQHGISAFCYYHYWFNGRRILERPFDEVLATGRPDFPFCLCWANEPWTRNWDGGGRDILIPQSYSEEDDRAHIRWLIEAFKDERYVRTNTRPILLVYNAAALPYPARTTTTWREECVAAGVGQPYLIKCDTFSDERDPAEWGFDAASEFLPHTTHLAAAEAGVARIHDTTGLGNTIWDYDAIVDAHLARPLPRWTRYQCVFPGWDNTPRMPHGHAHLFLNATPEGYENWLRGTYRKAWAAGQEFVFINAWNEWAESAHLEPDIRFGRASLEATARVFGADPGHGRDEPRSTLPPESTTAPPPEAAASADYRALYFNHRAAVATEMERLLRIIQDLQDGRAGAGADPSRPERDPAAGAGPVAAGAPSNHVSRISVPGRIARTARLLRRDWHRL